MVLETQNAMVSSDLKRKYIEIILVSVENIGTALLAYLK